VAIAVGTTLDWIGNPSSQVLAWILVSGGLVGAVFAHLLGRPATAKSREAIPVSSSDPESWSYDIAVLAADALTDAGFVQVHDKNRAAEVIGEEIAVRLSIGDYPAHVSRASENSAVA
jgi:hypothetical protein